MSHYDFDALIERKDTDSLKYDFHERRGKAPDLLPLWVADMDFALPPEVLDSVVSRVEHGVFGYSMPRDDYFEAVHDWLLERHGWETQREWVTVVPGVVFAIATAIRAFTEPGDSVLIQPPVYYPFAGMIRANGREVVEAPLSYDGQSHHYTIDFEAFEAALETSGAKLFLLCNPHNPGGRVWTRDELARLGEICLAHDCLVVSDEIHADFARPGFEHVVFADIDERFANASITCTSPSKSFNMAGLQIANTIIPNQQLRRRYRNEHNATGYGELNSVGLVAARACYRKGGEWFDALKDYLEGNLAFMKDFLARRAPALAVVEPGSTYLVWVDCKALGLEGEELRAIVEDKARLWLDMGEMFGTGGNGFIRFNIACPRVTLERALVQLADALTSAGF